MSFFFLLFFLPSPFSFFFLFFKQLGVGGGGRPLLPPPRYALPLSPPPPSCTDKLYKRALIREVLWPWGQRSGVRGRRGVTGRGSGRVRGASPFPASLTSGAALIFPLTSTWLHSLPPLAPPSSAFRRHHFRFSPYPLPLTAALPSAAAPLRFATFSVTILPPRPSRMRVAPLRLVTARRARAPRPAS